MVPASSVTFGPRRQPAWIARIMGGGVCLFGAGFVAAGILVAHQVMVLFWSFGLMGVGAAVCGAWLVVQGSRISRLRAAVARDGLRLTAHGGRHVWFQRGLASADIPWAEIQGFTVMRTSNVAAKGGTQTTYFLYTRRGDFTLNDMQWEDLDGLLREISARSGRAPGVVAEERAAAKAEVEAGERRVYKFQRVFGWATVIACVPVAVLVLVAGMVRGFSRDIVRVLGMLTVAAGIGLSMTRYYRK